MSRTVPGTNTDLLQLPINLPKLLIIVRCVLNVTLPCKLSKI